LIRLSSKLWKNVQKGAQMPHASYFLGIFLERRKRSSGTSLQMSFATQLNQMEAEVEKTAWADVSLAELKAAAESGDLGAQCALGKKIKQEDAAAAVRWFRAAAEQGHAEAQDELGECFYTGRGVDEDDVEAVRWYRKAAERTRRCAVRTWSLFQTRLRRRSGFCGGGELVPPGGGNKVISLLVKNTE
jgi:Sel1 repeat